MAGCDCYCSLQAVTSPECSPRLSMKPAGVCVCVVHAREHVRAHAVMGIHVPVFGCALWNRSKIATLTATDVMF